MEEMIKKWDGMPFPEMIRGMVLHPGRCASFGDFPSRVNVIDVFDDSTRYQIKSD